MLDAGKYFLKKQKRSTGVSDAELIKIAVKSLGLDDLSPFNPNDKIIEYKLRDESRQSLNALRLCEFINLTASEFPAPGGGSVSAAIGAMGIALGTMVANLSSHKKGWDDRWEEFSDFAEKGKNLQETLTSLIDEDTRAFNNIMSAFSLPKNTQEDKDLRNEAIQQATLKAIEVPFQTMTTAFEGFELIKQMVKKGNPNSITDAGVGALALRTCIMGAWLNVKINANSFKDKKSLEKMMQKGEQIIAETMIAEKGILEDVYTSLNTSDK
jgi:glutamate formiminotransferase/formiminotetrahydrofolate cyclodeaminase